MQRVTVICVGKLKERFYIDAAAEYAKRLSRYCRLELLELACSFGTFGAKVLVLRLPALPP